MKSLNVPAVRQGVRLAFVLAFIFLAGRFLQSWARAPLYGAAPDYDSEMRVNWWMLSANCFKATKIPLVICMPDGHVRPLEDMYTADDRGHAMLATVAALFKSGLVDRVTLTRINLSINGVGIALLAGMFLMAGMPWTAVLCLVFGTQYGMPGPIPGHDSPASYFGIFCLAAAPVVWVTSYFSTTWPARKAWLGGILSFGCLTWAYLLRQPIGLIGIAMVAVILFCFLLLENKRWREKRLYFWAALFLLWLPMQAAPIVLSLRNLCYKIPASHAYPGHGIWHALYVGLGWGENPWGISWDDRMGIKAVLRRNPDAVYGTEEYFRTMKHMYLNLLLRQPGAVFRVYWAKAVETWQIPLLYGGVRITRWFLVISALLAYVIGRERKVRYPLRILLALAVLFVLFSMQGVLAIPIGRHLYPLKFCLLLMLSCWADVILSF